MELEAKGSLVTTDGLDEVAVKDHRSESLISDVDGKFGKAVSWS